MLNQIVIAGRLTSDPAIEEKEEKKYSYITVAVPRAYKNTDGVYETDFIRCQLWGGIAENTAEYCRKGDIVGVKGRLQTTITADGVKYESLKLKLENLNTLFDELKPIIDSKKYNDEDLELFKNTKLGIKETLDELEKLSNSEKYITEVIAEKISFLSSAKKDDE